MCELSVSNFVLRGIMCVNAFEFSLFVVLRHVLVHASCECLRCFCAGTYALFERVLARLRASLICIYTWGFTKCLVCALAR
jgi:hypothetical protein